MIYLSNNCRCSELKVHPKNWRTTKASLKKTWYISYRFYDDKTCRIKRVYLKKMNSFKNLVDRQEKTISLIEMEMEMLKVNDYNPITGTSRIQQKIGIDSNTMFNEAIEYAFQQLKVQKTTASDIKSCKKYIKSAADVIYASRIPIGAIRRRHIKEILDQCEKMKPTWNNRMFNHYRKYLAILFNQLLEIDIIEFNPVQNVTKRKIIKKIRPTLNDEERQKVDDYLKKKNYNKWRFMHIFFHSGARVTELFKIKKSHVDIKNQRYIATILKGKEGREAWRPIKNIVLPLWQELVDKASPDQYLFSRRQEPGNESINPHQISRWWRTIKKELNIKADFYSLKHSNTTEVSEYLGAKEAAKLNGHTTDAMVKNIYDVGRERREHAAIIQFENPFVKSKVK